MRSQGNGFREMASCHSQISWFEGGRDGLEGFERRQGARIQAQEMEIPRSENGGLGPGDSGDGSSSSVVNPMFVEEQPQILRLRKSHETRLAALRVCDFIEFSRFFNA